MESIRVTPETMAQYKADCQADYARIRKEKRQLAKIEKSLGLTHDREFVGKFIFVPQEYVKECLTKSQIRALVGLHG